MKKTISVLLLILSMFLCGCWDNNDINDLIIVSSIALDKGTSKDLKTTLLCIRPSVGIISDKVENNSNDIIIFSAEGDNIMDCCNNISKRVSRKLFFSQIENIIIGESIAKENVGQYLDFFPRHPEPPLKTHVFITKSEASKMFSYDSLLERNIAQEIDKLKSLNTTAETKLKDVIFALTEDGIDPIIPVIGLARNDVSDSSKDIYMASIIGAGIFKKSKLVDFVDFDTYRGVLYIQNKIKIGVGTVPFSKQSGDGRISAKILNSKTSITPIVENNKIQMKINIKTKAHLSENTTKLDFTKSSNISEIEKMFEQRITNLVQTSLDRIKNDNCSDVFGFGELINGKYPKLWTEIYQKNWREVLPKVTVKLSCKVEITEIGFDAKSIQLGEEDFLK